MRYRVNARPLSTLRRTADLVFPAAQVAVFVDGCFWHGCPDHTRWPKTNAKWWRDKISRTQARDYETDAVLTRNGWLVVRVWEHEPPSEAADRIQEALRKRRPA